jgi:hypothetical protein
MDIQEKEIKALESVKSLREWNEVCSKIKATRGGVYPSDWYHKMLRSGLMHRITSDLPA